MNENHLTIEETAIRLGVSKDTIRRRIKKGDIQAIKAQGPYGEQYYIPESEIDTAQVITDVIPVTRQLNINDLSDLLEELIEHKITWPMQTTMQDIQARQLEEIKLREAMKQQLESMQQELTATKTLLECQEQERKIVEIERDKLAKERDKKLVKEMRELLKDQRSPWWKRLFGK